MIGMDGYGANAIKLGQVGTENTIMEVSARRWEDSGVRVRGIWEREEVISSWEGLWMLSLCRSPGR
jgi:hypothetical protein